MLSAAALKNQREAKKRYSRERYYWLRENGFCVTCGSAYAEPGRCRCEACKAKADAVKEGKYAEWYAGYRQLIASRKAAGLCVNCGKPVVPGRTRCEKHMAAFRDYQRCRTIKKRLGG